MQSRKVIVAGNMCSYLQSVHIDGPVTLFLHGRGDSSATFKAMLDRYERDGKSFIAPDFPGFGGSEWSGNDWGVSEYVDRLCLFVEKIGIKYPFRIVAHSFGCRVALKGVYNGRLHVDSLLFIGAGGVQESLSGTKIRVLKRGKKILSLFGLQGIIERVQSSIRSDDYRLAGNLEGSFAKIVSEDLQYTMGSIHVPVILIWGEKDTQTPLVHGKIFDSLLPTSVLHTFPQGTHFVHQEFPDEIYSLGLHINPMYRDHGKIDKTIDIQNH